MTGSPMKVIAMSIASPWSDPKRHAKSLVDDLRAAGFEIVASGGSGEAPADRFTVERAPDGLPAIVEGEAPAGLTEDEIAQALYARGMGEPGVEAVLAFIEDPLPGWHVRGPVGGEAGQET